MHGASTAQNALVPALPVGLTCRTGHKSGGLMKITTYLKYSGVFALTAALAACGGSSTQTTSAPAGPPARPGSAIDLDSDQRRNLEPGQSEPTTIWDAFRRGNTEVEVAVNKYLWSATLEILEFLPVESVDPFTGVIITGYGTPPGGGRAYRATVLIDDPALDARSLNLSLQTRNGPASAATIRAVEDAILTRARQIRNLDASF